VSYDKGKKNAIMNYDEIIKQLTHINNDEADDRWIIDSIQGHRWSRSKKGKMEILIKWKDLDEPSWEPIEIIKEDDSVTLAEYARDNDLLNKAKWKWADRYLHYTMTT
jgi:hypothetical protein